uniref:Uncharacterized protein n=1 Tax=Ixodes ricinus TaxID=34613 RepID=A0A6B0TS18_IXORI
MGDVAAWQMVASSSPLVLWYWGSLAPLPHLLFSRPATRSRKRNPSSTMRAKETAPAATTPMMMCLRTSAS